MTVDEGGQHFVIGVTSYWSNDLNGTNPNEPLDSSSLTDPTKLTKLIQVLGQIKVSKFFYSLSVISLVFPICCLMFPTI